MLIQPPNQQREDNDLDKCSESQGNVMPCADQGKVEDNDCDTDQENRDEQFPEPVRPCRLCFINWFEYHSSYLPLCILHSVRILQLHHNWLRLNLDFIALLERWVVDKQMLVKGMVMADAKQGPKRREVFDEFLPDGVWSCFDDGNGVSVFDRFSIDLIRYGVAADVFGRNDLCDRAAQFHSISPSISSIGFHLYS